MQTNHEISSKKHYKNKQINIKVVTITCKLFDESWFCYCSAIDRKRVNDYRL